MNVLGHGETPDRMLCGGGLSRSAGCWSGLLVVASCSYDGGSSSSKGRCYNRRVIENFTWKENPL